MASTFCGASRLPGRSFTSTLALAGCCDIQKHRILGEGHVDARLLHFRQRHHRALQFAFERPPVVDVLGEFGGAQIGLVEEFEPDAAGLGQPRRRPY